MLIKSIDKFAQLTLAVCLLYNLHHVNSRSLESKSNIVISHSGSEYLDSENKYLLSWNISDEQETIYFEVTAETTGFIGFGISPNGAMTGADIFIAGVNSTGNLYSSDRHGEGNTMPVEDVFANWNVTFGQETATHTTLRFHRLLNTCDEDDIQITDGTMRIIWALGQTDDLSYHGSNRGTKSMNFYLQDEHEFDPEKFEVMNMLVNMEMPSEHTAYWCTIHKAPLFTQKQHIVGFEAVLENLPALTHTHHFILRRCLAPPGQDPDELFGPWVQSPGDYCYGPRNFSFPFLSYCSQDALYVWSKGGKRLAFPPNLGLPMPEQLGQSEYFSIDIHYDNPTELEGMVFQTGARMYYTSELRETEIGMIRINQDVLPQLTIPPQAKDFVVTGHCSNECTQMFLPEEGVTVFNNLFHAHLAGRKLKLRHFRGEEELPWLDVDEYYDFDFQQNKPLSEYRKVLRGDQLTVECTYDTMTAPGGKAVMGGLGTREEMCEAIIYFYPKVDFTFCGSFQDMDEHFNLLGVTEYREDYSNIAGAYEYIILKPDHLAGEYLDSVSYKVNWTSEFRERFQSEKRFGEQVGFCQGVETRFEGTVKYPENLNVYVPPNECEGVTQPTPRTTTRQDCGGEDCADFEDWIKSNIGIIKEQLTRLQESVDMLAGNSTGEHVYTS